ncbi:MAG: TRAP transporter small permease [Thermodesulfobacteriota bacterium]|nr:TRAP transporter small permease [Thermodesulfobacteriota bacterium]
MVSKITNGIHWISDIFFRLGWAAASFMLITTCYDVIMRYLFAKPTSWAVELNAIFLVYMGFLCAAALVKKGQHIDMSLIVTRLSIGTQKRVDVLNSVLTILFCGVLGWMGGKATIATLKYGMYTAGDFHVPLWIVYIVIPLGCLFVGLEYILHIVEERNGGENVS